MRIYLPSTLSALSALLAEGAVRGTPLTAYAVTPELGEDGDDTEELEYEALRSAADASLRLLAGEPESPRRRVVIAADVPDRIVEPAGDPDEPAAVAVTGTVPLKRVAAAHVDEEDAVTDIAAAVADPAAGHEEEHELLWYATQELGHLLE